MSKLTKAEKIELAESQVREAELMVKSSRENLDKWIGNLEIRQEYLEAVTKVTDLVLDDSRAKPVPVESAPTSIKLIGRK